MYKYMYIHCMYVLMRDEKEGRSKAHVHVGQTNNKAKLHSTSKAITVF